MRRRARALYGLLFTAAAAVLVATAVYPLGRMLFSAARHGHGAVLWEGVGLEAIRNTALIGLGTVAGAGVLGTALAFALARRSFPGRSVVAGLAYMPFTLPPLAGVLSFYYLISPDGLVPRFAEQVLGLQGLALTGPAGILFVHTYSFFVFFYAMVSSALEGIDVSQAEAARTLGAGRWRVFTRVTLPELRPALAGAALLTYMSSCASFSAPLFFGSGFPYLSVLIYEETGQFHPYAAQTLSVALLAVSFAGVFVFRTRKRHAGAASKGVRRPLASPAARWLAAAGSALFVLLLLLPHAAIVWLSLADHRQWYDEVAPTHFTLDNYALIFTDPGYFEPIRNSLWMSAAAAGAAVAVGLPAAYVIGRRRPGAFWLNLLVMLPWALPGTVVAINLIAAFNNRWLPLHGTVWMLPLAYFVRGIPLWTRMGAASFETFDADLVEAGRTLGASPGYCFRRIALPLLAPALVAATTLVFATSLGEFVSSVLLYTPANTPISVKIHMLWRGSGLGSAFAYGVLLMVMVAASFVLARRFGSRVLQ